jgi:hypothetical protein
MDGDEVLKIVMELRELHLRLHSVARQIAALDKAEYMQRANELDDGAEMLYAVSVEIEKGM